VLDHERAFDLERLILLCLDIYVFLGLHKALESGQFERTRRSLEIEASVLREIFMRWVPGEPFERAMAMFDGTDESRFPDVDSLRPGTEDA
jgi:hypothetical protein